ncbi:MAG: GNAT family N-acetyltransferase [Legionella sp.]|jgi:aminoglycoside 6'-N-acetyltransferase
MKKHEFEGPIIQFKQLVEEDLELLYSWFKEPTINKMYARGLPWTLDDIKQKYLPRILGYEKFPSFIIMKDNHPIGFIQYYCLADFLAEGIMNNENPLFDKHNPKEVAGIDLFIAEGVNRGNGLGVTIISQFIGEYLTCFQVVVDPEINNATAIRCYEKCGFIKTTISQNPKYYVMIKKLS